MRVFSIPTASVLFFYAAGTVAVKVPGAIDIPFGEVWAGNDGNWSTFPVAIGTPLQTVYVLPSTSGTATWLVGYLGCNDSWVDSPSPLPAGCVNLRGGLFDNRSSSTWQPKNAIYPFGLQAEDYVGDDVSAYFGFDQVFVGWQGTGVGLSNSTVAWFEDEAFAVGMLGLNYRPTNFSTPDDRSPAFLNILYEQNLIPSLSYGYTAGAYYRGKDSVFNHASLVLGGYDKLKIEPNEVVFLFGGDISKDLTVGVEAITAFQNSEEVTLLPSSENFFIDSTTSQIWLPSEACSAFEKAFGLVYDNSSGLYLINDTQHDILVAQNSSITFTLAAKPGVTVNITLPYAAFDLWVSWGYNITQPSRYFPIRQANGTQYTLGRTFLQEAYLYVDDTAQTFTVSQRAWHTANPSSLILPQPYSYLSHTMIITIAVAISVPLALIAFSIWFFLRRRRIAARKRKEEEEAEAARRAREKEEAIVPDPFATPDGAIGELHAEKLETPELFGRLLPFNGQEVDGTHASELRYELGRGMEGIEGRHELEAPHGVSQAPASIIEEEVGDASDSEGSMKSVEIAVSQPTETEGSTQGEAGSSIDPVSPESSGGSSRGLLEGEDPVSPQSPQPVKLQNDRHLIYGFF